MKVTLTIELTFDEDIMYSNDEEGKEWFFNGILLSEELLLHSNEIGDTIGTVRVLRIGV